MKRIAVTTENGMIFQHFGKTAYFTIVEAEGETVISSRVVDTNGNGHSALGGFLKDAGVEVLICGGIGQGARDVLSEAGIAIVSGAQGSVEAAVAAYLKGELIDSPLGACDHHDHEHGHDCGEHDHCH